MIIGMDPEGSGSGLIDVLLSDILRRPEEDHKSPIQDKVLA
jgi:hypothetical protein